jgi:high-affinity iron transporter
MLQALIITLREGVEAALIVGITLAYLSKIGRPELRKLVYWALGAAFFSSLAVAVAVSHWELNQDIFEGWIMLAAAVFVASMVIFMMKAGKTMKGSIESKVGGLAGTGSQIGLFAFIFLMVLREGVETVLILATVSFNTSELLRFLGTLIGVALAVVFGVMFVKGSVRIDLRKFFKITTVILFFVAAQLLVTGLHELSENGVIPSNKAEMATIGPIVRNDWFFAVTILALTGMMVLLEYRRRAPLAVAATKVEHRKAEWSFRRERLWMIAVCVTCFIFIASVTAEFVYAKSATALSPATPITFVNGKAAILKSQVSDGDLHRYAANIGGTEVRFLLYQKPDGKIATVLDACEICGSIGYYKTAQGLVCKNCAAPVNPQSVGQSGGCNPIPLHAGESGDSVVIEQAELQAAAIHFRK